MSQSSSSATSTTTTTTSTSFFNISAESINKGFDSIIDSTNKGIKGLKSNLKGTHAAIKTLAEEQVKDRGSLWEVNENVTNCRHCYSAFDLLRRKHHCRQCLGIYCEICADASIESSVRVCIGCKRGETPSDSIIQYMKDSLDLELKTENITQAREAKRNGETTTASTGSKLCIASSQPKYVALEYGSLYGEDNTMRKKKVVPASGYFELYNKSSSCIAIKVLYTGCNVQFEIPRPSYYSLPPNTHIHGSFDSNAVGLDIIMLSNNPHALPTNAKMIYDTKQPGALQSIISPCAKINQFKKVTTLHVNCFGKNVLLKCKGDEGLMPRMGNSISRVGLINKLSGLRYGKNSIDYSTNIDTIVFGKTFRA